MEFASDLEPRWSACRLTTGATPLQPRFPLRFPAQTRLRLLPRPAARSKDVIHGFKPEDDGDFISTIHAVFKTFSEHCVDVLRDRSLQVSGVLGRDAPPFFECLGVPAFPLLPRRDD